MLPTNPLLNATAPAGPHLPVATLRQYAAGTLPPAAQHRVEAHTLACPRCADILTGLLQTTPATTDQALAQLQQRLRQRVQQSAARSAPRPRSSHRWLVPQLAAAATLLFGLVVGGWWTWQQRHMAAEGSKQVATTQVPEAPVAPTAPSAPSAAEMTIAAASASVRVATPPSRHLPRRAAHHAWAAHAARPAPAPGQEARVASAPDASAVASAPAKPPAAMLAEVAPLADKIPAAPVPVDSTALRGRAAGLAISAKRTAAPSDQVYDRAMPAAPSLPPTPVGGYGAWREQLRREATEFKPEPPEQPLSGTVQLRLLIGADGKIQEMRVLHGLRADYDAEAQRLVCEGPAWVPGIGGGKRAAHAVDVAVPF